MGIFIYRKRMVIITAFLLIIVCALIYYKGEATNKELPKKATLVINRKDCDSLNGKGISVY